MIEEDDEAWRGGEPADVEEFLRAYAEDGYPVDALVHAACACGSVSFHLECDADQGVVRGACTACGTLHWGFDSREYWDESEPESIPCPLCGHDSYNVAIGVSHHESDTSFARWIYVGIRCLHCRALGSPVDWKLDGPLVASVLARAWTA